MKILMHSETDITMSEFDAPAFDIETAPGAEAHYSALQMFATSLGLCTASVLMAYAEQISVATEGLQVRLRWQYAEKPFRVGGMEMDIVWPSLPENRLRAAERAASQCTIHNTLHHPPELVTRVQNG